MSIARLHRLARSLDSLKISPLRNSPTTFFNVKARQSFLQNQRRPIQTRHYSSAPPPPPPLASRTTNRLLYKPDGTPRSKFTGLAIAALATLSFLLYEALEVIDELDHSVHLLAALLHVQRADYRLFAATNLADPVHLLRLYRALQAPVNPALEDIYGDLEKSTFALDQDSATDAGEKVYERMCAILREACEGVHDILHDPLEEAHELAAASKIVDLLDSSFGEVLRTLEILRQRADVSASPVEGTPDVHAHRSKGEEYEVVG